MKTSANTDGETPSSRFSSRLVSTMEKRSISSARLAEMIFVSHSTITGYRSGRRRPDLDQLVRIAEALSVSTDYLLGLTSSPDKRQP